MQPRDIFERERSGEVIALDDPEYVKIAELITEAQTLIAEINTGYHTPQEVINLFERLIGAPVHSSFWMLPPFYTDFGKNIRVGRDVFINHCCEFMDRGGITLEDRVLIGPRVNLITINHPVQPSRRRSTFCAPILIKRNAWIGAAASSHAWSNDWRKRNRRGECRRGGRCSTECDCRGHTCEDHQDLRRGLALASATVCHSRERTTSLATATLHVLAGQRVGIKQVHDAKSPRLRRRCGRQRATDRLRPNKSS